MVLIYLLYLCYREETSLAERVTDTSLEHGTMTDGAVTHGLGDGAMTDDISEDETMTYGLDGEAVTDDIPADITDDRYVTKAP